MLSPCIQGGAFVVLGSRAVVTNGPVAAATAIALACFALSSLGARADDVAPADAPARAAAAVRGKIPHAKGEVKIDGVLDDEIWTHALVVDLAFETYPRENGAAPVATKAYLVEDGSRLLVAFDARDSNPKSIRAYLRDSDTAWNDDFVGIVIDTFNDERRAFEFFANPLGVQMDAIQDDVNRFENTAWNAIWDSAGKITGDGYVVEIAIRSRRSAFRARAASRFGASTCFGSCRATRGRASRTTRRIGTAVATSVSSANTKG